MPTAVGIAPEVERFRAVFESYARQEGVFDQVNIIMALTMQESGGRSLDIMQRAYDSNTALKRSTSGAMPTVSYSPSPPPIKSSPT